MKNITRVLEEFLIENKSHEYEIGKIFADWFLDPNTFQAKHKDRPCWCVEKYKSPELMYIHFWDFALDRMRHVIKKYCGKNRLRPTDETEELFQRAMLAIYFKDKKILEMHDSTCSTPSNPYICFHTTLDPKALKFLVRFPFSLDYRAISLKDFDFYNRLIKELIKEKQY